MTKNLLFIFCFLALNIQAQNKKVLDSLNTVYNTTKYDTTRILALTAIASEYINNKPDTFIIITQKALEKSEQINYRKGQGNAYDLFAHYYFTKINYPLALEYYQKSLRINEELRNKSDISLILHAIGSIYQNQGNYTSALEYYQKSLKIKEEIKDKQGIAASLHNMGLIYQIQGDYPLSLEYYKKTLKINEELGAGQGITNSLFNIGVIYSQQGNYPLALEYYQKSLKFSESLGSKQIIARNLNAIGLIYRGQGDYPLALEYLKKGLKTSEEAQDKQIISAILLNIGGIYEDLDNYALALEYCEKSLKIKEEIKDKRGISFSLNNIGSILSQQGEWVKAIDYFEKSLKIKKEMGDKQGISNALNGLSQVYQQQKEYDKSIEYAQEGLKLAQEIKALSEIDQLSHTLYDTYKLKGDYIKALEYHELYKQTNDSLFNVDKTKKIANLESRAEIERKEKEITILNKNKELLEKDNQVQKIENEKEKNAKLAIEQQAKADRLFALARQEQDKRKQDSLTSLAQKAQLLADNLKINEQKLQAESKAKELEILKEKEVKEFQQAINYLVLTGLLAVLVFAYFIFKSREKEKKAKEIISLQKEELTIQSEKLLEANNSKDKLFAILGHDLRSPINSLEGFLNLMQSGVISVEEFQTHLPYFYSNVKNVQNMLSNLLQWSLSQMNGITALPTQVDTKQVISENIKLFTEIAATKSITLLTNLPDNVFVWADENHFRLLLRNLINNAIKFTPKDGQIKVEIQQKQTNIEISIADNGVGMTEEQMAKLFKKNQNSTTSGTSGEKGTGLGLQFCQEIVAKNGGEIWVNSTKGEGSIFTFSLPRKLD